MEAISLHNLPEHRARNLVDLSRSQFKYIAKEKDDSIVIHEIQTCIEKRSHGCPMIIKMIRKKGLKINHKRIERVYKELRLTLPKKVRKRLPERLRKLILHPLQENICWSMDFMSDSLIDGRKIRLLNIMDDYNREGLALEIETSIPTRKVIKTLNRIAEHRGLPKEIRVDNGPEYISHELKQWAFNLGITLTYIQPGKPTQNSLIERFNGTCRRELLNASLFYSLDHARELASEWMHEYNYLRPHTALGDRTPIEFKLWRSTLPYGQYQSNSNQLINEAQEQIETMVNKPADVGVDLCF